LNGNSYEFVNCLSKIYSRATDITRVKEKLENASVEVAGVEVLRIADKEGKGWLALLVAEQLVYNSYIPDYILKAIAFSSAHINLSSKVKAVMHRLKSICGNDKDTSFEATKTFVVKDKTQQELLDTFIAEFKGDQLTRFLAML
jgi:putative ATP-dependent endonuclease of the OLD family